jgi:hypothetical protein
MKKRAAIQKPESSCDFIKDFSHLNARLRGHNELFDEKA